MLNLHNRIYSVVILTIMLLSAILISGSYASSVPTAAAYGNDYYTVRKEDSLFLISRTYGTTVYNIKQENGLKSDMIMPGQVLKIPANGQKQSVKSLREILSDKGIDKTRPGISIVVDKSDHSLSLYSYGGVFLKSYHVELGDNGLGDKQVSGDHKTPEGKFYICEKSVLSPSDEYLGSRWMRLSYPNIEDANRGLNNGLINSNTFQSIVTATNRGQIPPQRTALGGGVGIHGGSIPKFGPDWTWGCVGLKNSDVEDFYDYVTVGTPVTIQK